MQSFTQRKRRRTSWLFAGIAAGFFCCGSAFADEQSPCTGFSWPLDTEVSWLTGGDGVAVTNGGALSSLPASAIRLAMAPSKTVTLPVASGIKKQAIAPESFSGWFTLSAVPKPGLYQVSLSHEGWIDVAQNGELLQSAAFTGKKECTALRKSVRFNIGAGPVTIQIGGAPSAEIKIVIREAN